MSFHKSKSQKSSEQRKYVRGQKLEQIKQQKREVVEAQQMESQYHTPQQLYSIVQTCNFYNETRMNLKIISFGQDTLDTIIRLKLDTPQNLKELDDSLNQLNQQRYSLRDQIFKNKLDRFDQMLYDMGSKKFKFAIEYIRQKFEAKSSCAVLHKQLISDMPEPDKSLLRNPFMMDKLLKQIFKEQKIQVRLKPHSIFVFTGLSRRQKANEKIILSNVQQKGVIAYFVLQYIASFQPSKYLQKNESIRERLFKQVDLKIFILEKFNSISQIQFHDVKDLGLKDINFATVLYAFDLQRGFYYDSQVFNQERFRRSHPDADNCSLPIKWLIPEQPSNDSYVKNHLRKTVLNPIIFTGLIIKKLKTRTNRIIYGDKGIGKSFTFLLYSYLSSYIIQARMQEQHQGLIKYKIYDKILTEGDFEKYPKLFYIPIEGISSFQGLSNNIMKQINGKHQKIKINTENLKIAQTQDEFVFLNYQIRQEYHKKQIEILIVVDQAENYYHLARRYFLNQLYPNIMEELQQKSVILKFISTQMFPYILNSCQMIKKLVLSRFLKDKNLYDYYADGNFSDTNIKLQYSPFLNEPEGRLQLYNVYAFELSKYLSVKIADLSKLTIFNDIIQKQLQNYISGNSDCIKPWRIIVKHINISLAMRDVNSTRKNKQDLQKFISQENKQKVELIFWKIKDQIQLFATHEMNGQIVLFYRNQSSQSDKKFRFQLILQLRCAAFSMFNKQVQYFFIDISELTNLITFDQDFYALPKQKMPPYSNSLFRLPSIFRYQKDSGRLFINCKPIQFIDFTNFIVEHIYKQQKILNIYERIYSKKTSELTEFQFGYFLNLFATRLFKRGYFQIQYTQHTSLSEKKDIKFRIIKGFKFESLNSTNDINQSLRYLFYHADKFPNEDFYCITADKKSNQGLDFLLLRKRSHNADYQLITFDFITAQIPTCVNKRISKNDQMANTQKQKVQNFFIKANLSQQELNFLLAQIEQAFPEHHDEINMNILVDIVTNLTQNKEKQNIIRESILKLIICEGKLQNEEKSEQISEKIKKFMSRLRAYITNKGCINKMLGIFGVRKSFSQVEVQIKLQNCYKQNLTQFQYNTRLIQGRAIFIKLIAECSLQTKQDLIKFIKQIHSASEQANKTIPQQLRESEKIPKYLQRHHFCTPFKHLSNQIHKNDRNSLLWKHVFAVPSYRVQQYQQQITKKKGQYLFEDIFFKQNDRKKSLQFAIGSFEFDQKNIVFMPQDRYMGENDDQKLLQKQYNFIQKLMKIMLEKRKDREFYHL